MTTITTPPVNPVVQKVDDIIQTLLYGLGVNMAISYIIAQVPFLGLPVIKGITTWLITQIANVIFKFLDQFVDFSIVDFETNEEETAYLGAVTNLQNALASGDQDAITKAQAQFSSTAQSLIHFDGV